MSDTTDQEPTLQPHQRPPEEPWSIFHLNDTRRASGKTFAGGHAMADLIRRGGDYVLVAHSRSHIEKVMVPELVRWLGAPDRVVSGSVLVWGDARVGYVPTTWQDTLRGMHLAGAWWDEPHLERSPHAIYETDLNLAMQLRAPDAKLIVSGAYWIPTRPKGWVDEVYEDVASRYPKILEALGPE